MEEIPQYDPDYVGEVIQAYNCQLCKEYVPEWINKTNVLSMVCKPCDIQFAQFAKLPAKIFDLTADSRKKKK